MHPCASFATADLRLYSIAGTVPYVEIVHHWLSLLGFCASFVPSMNVSNKLGRNRSVATAHAALPDLLVAGSRGLMTWHA